MVDKPGLVSVSSRYDVAETTRRFCDAAKAAGLTIFADIDHGRNAEDVGMPLRPTQLILFGNPKGGTPLMQFDQTIGIDLPFKALAWRDAWDQTWLSWNDPRWLAARHGLDAAADPAVDAIAAGMDKLAAAATG